MYLARNTTVEEAKTSPSEESSNDEEWKNILAVSQFVSTSYRLSEFSNRTKPKAGDKIIYIDGDWDLFHCGHAKALEAAKALGDYLYVGIYDDSIVRYIKDSQLAGKGKKKKKVKGGAHWPMMCTQERALNVLASKWVDDVIMGCPFEVSKDLITVLDISKVVVPKHLVLDGPAVTS